MPINGTRIQRKSTQKVIKKIRLHKGDISDLINQLQKERLTDD